MSEQAKTRKGPIPFFAVVASLALCLASCGEPEERGGGGPSSGVPDGAAVTGAKGGGSRRGASTADRTPDPFADLTATLVEKVGLLPVAYFETTVEGVSRPCMGAYVGGGRFVTAAHCFAGLVSDGCPSGLRLKWLRHEGGAYLAGPDATACETIKRRVGTDASGADIAIVKLSAMGSWPETGVVFEAPEAHREKTLKMVGPQTAGPSPVVRARYGRFYELKPTYLLFNAAPTPGFSGAPVFLETEGSVGPIGPSSKVLGFYMGSSDGASRVLRSDRIAPLLSE